MGSCLLMNSVVFCILFEHNSQIQRYFLREVTFMLFPEWMLKGNGLHGSNGITLTCHGINQSFGLVTSLRMGEYKVV